MFAAGAAIVLLWVLMAIGRPLAAKSIHGGRFLGVGVGLMIMSLLIFAWKHLP